jgi:hypothetical protein
MGLDDLLVVARTFPDAQRQHHLLLVTRPVSPILPLAALLNLLRIRSRGDDHLYTKLERAKFTQVYT